MAVDYASAQELSDGAFAESYIAAGAAPLERRIAVPASHVRRSDSFAVRLYGVTTGVLRVFVRVLYVFPALIVAKAVLWGAGIWYGDLITVAFVVLVVTLFAMLAIVLLLFAIVGPRSQRGRGAGVEFAPPRGSVIDRVEANLARRASFRVIGRIDAGLEAGAPVLVEQWSAHAGRLVRFVEGSSFLVLADGAPPTAVVVSASPVLLAAYAHGAAEASPFQVAGRLAAKAHELSPVGHCILRQGDRVEILAEAAAPAARLEDARLDALLSAALPSDPYRGGERGAMVVRSTPEAPVVVRRLA